MFQDKMKLTKTVKYNYKLTEESLEKDINKFIFESKKGWYQMDRHNNGEGLKIIKQYFRILEEKFKKEEFEECKICYEKLILFCINASGANDCDNLFDYEDLLAKITQEFDDYIKNYFISLVKTCDIEELAERVSRYAQHLDIYGFDSDVEVLVKNLDKLQLDNLETRMLIKTEGMTKKDYSKHEIIYFLMNLAKERKQKEKYIQLYNKFKGVLDDKEVDSMIEEYEE